MFAVFVLDDQHIREVSHAGGTATEKPVPQFYCIEKRLTSSAFKGNRRCYRWQWLAQSLHWTFVELFHPMNKLLHICVDCFGFNPIWYVSLQLGVTVQRWTTSDEELSRLLYSPRAMWTMSVWHRHWWLLRQVVCVHHWCFYRPLVHSGDLSSSHLVLCWMFY